MGTFAERTHAIGERVGHGDLTGRLTIGGGLPYSIVQHRGYWVSGPLAGVVIREWTKPGSGPEYVSGPLEESEDAMMAMLAASVLAGGGHPAMELSMQLLRGLVETRTPELEGVLVGTLDTEVTG